VRNGVSLGYLPKTCDTAASGVTVASSVQSASVALFGMASKYSLTLDIDHLNGGRHYHMCLDLDGASGPMKYVDSTPSTQELIYLNPVTSFETSKYKPLEAGKKPTLNLITSRAYGTPVIGRKLKKFIEENPSTFCLTKELHPTIDRIIN